MTNNCNYSDNWQPYIGDYDKFEYDIKLHDGTIVESCYPNAQKFNSFSKEHTGKLFDEKDIAEIRFAHNRILMLDNEFSEIPIIYPEYTEEAKRVYELTMIDSFPDCYQPVTKRQQSQIIEPVRSTPKILPNEPCSCGSGKKFKKCCKR